MSEPKSPYKRVRRHFSQRDLKRVCEMHETDFAEAYGTDIVTIQERKSDNFYLHIDNGSDILAVAHLDTVMAHERRTANFVSTQAGPVIYSGALDDRLGAYTILELLPKMGLKFDILLTVGEESGRSTAQFFEPAEDKNYNWMIEFDRGGSDVVMYQYDDADLRERVRKCGARPADGIFSDISYLEHLEIKGLNWGVGYKDYHGPRSHAYLEDYWTMIGHFIKFYEANADEYLPHDQKKKHWSRWGSSSESYSSLWSGDYESGYKSTRDESWWDQQNADAGSDLEEKKDWDESDYWTDEVWDIYIESGIEAARDAMRELEDDETVVFTADDDMVSDDFRDVNAALLEEESEPAKVLELEAASSSEA